MNRVMLTVLAVIFSQSAMAMSDSKQSIDVDKMIASAHQQGYAVAHCTSSVCRSTDDGNYVDISNAARDGYYVYDPQSADAPEQFDINKSKP